MKVSKLTLALAAAGVVSLGSIAQAEEQQHQVLTALSSTTLSGYVDTSANWRPGSNQGVMPGRTFDNFDKQDGFNLNVVKLSLEKPLDEGQWSAGYKVDLVFGPDANYYGTLLNAGSGYNTGVFANDALGVKQAYAALRVPVGNGIDVKMGVFDTIIGYEVFESIGNPNYSRSYGYALEPTHHTGVLASYKINDIFSVAGGVANGWTGPVNDKSGFSDTKKAYMGSLTLTLPESAGALKGTAIYLGIVNGRNTPKVLSAGSVVNNEDTTSWYAGATINTPVTGLAVGGAFDYREDGANTVTPGKNWAWAAAGYLSYEITKDFKLNGRADYTEGSDGTFFTAGHRNELLGLTLTADYALWANLVTRAEIRWDHAFHGDRPFFPATGSNFNREALQLQKLRRQRRRLRSGRLRPSPEPTCACARGCRVIITGSLEAGAFRSGLNPRGWFRGAPCTLCCRRTRSNSVLSM
jgi:hypothetical protein